MYMCLVLKNELSIGFNEICGEVGHRARNVIVDFQADLHNNFKVIPFSTLFFRS